MPLRGIHLAHRPLPASIAIWTCENASSSSFVPARTNRSSQRPYSEIRPMFFFKVSLWFSTRYTRMSLNICLSPAPSLTSLAQKRIFMARVGSSLKAKEKFLINLSLSCPLIAPIVKNRSTQKFSEEEFVAIPFSVTASWVRSASTNFITILELIYMFTFLFVSQFSKLWFNNSPDCGSDVLAVQKAE